jgi:hypothetical protein
MKKEGVKGLPTLDHFITKISDTKCFIRTASLLMTILPTMATYFIGTVCFAWVQNAKLYHWDTQQILMEKSLERLGMKERGEIT